MFHVFVRTFGSVLFLSLQLDQLQLRSDFHGRFLLAKEALMAQGMPVYADMLTQGVSMCSFSQPENIREHIPFARSSHVGQFDERVSVIVT